MKPGLSSLAFIVSKEQMRNCQHKSNPQLFHKPKLRCAKPVKNKIFFVRKLNADRHLYQVEKKFSKIRLICFDADQ